MLQIRIKYVKIHDDNALFESFKYGGKMLIKIYDKLPDEAKKIREKVFINEQGFSYDYDEIEYEEDCPHIWMKYDFTR